MFYEKEEKYSCWEVLAVLQKEPLCVVCLAEAGTPFCFLANSHAVYDRGSLNVYVSSLEEQQMPGCPPEKGAEVILRFICRLSDREKATVSVRGSVEKVYEREEKGDEICRQFPGGWPVWKICGITMRGRTICTL